MVVVLLASNKAHIWLLPCWHLKKLRYGCCPVDIFKIKSSDTVDVLLAFLNKKNLDTVVVLLGLLLNITHALLASSYFIKMH